MSDRWLREYVAGFSANGKVRTIGLEKELPVVDRKTGEMFDARKILPLLVRMGGIPKFDDYYHDQLQEVIMADGTVITNDSGMGNLEVALPKSNNLQEAEAKFDEWIGLLADEFKRIGAAILGYGIQPVTPPRKENWIKKRRHEIVCQNFGCIHDVNITIMSSDQAHVSVGPEEVVLANNVFNWLTGVIIAMFANSPVWQNQVDPNRLAVRERMWWFTPDSRHGIFPGQDQTIEQLFKRLISMRHLVAKNGNGDFYLPRMSFQSYLEQHPDRSFRDELPALEGTLWYCTRPRSTLGTVEIRPACAQPRESALCLAAFSLGIVERLAEAKAAIDSIQYPWEIARELREVAMDSGLKGQIDGISLSSLAEIFLTIAEDGLRARKLGEEAYLLPLWQRVKTKKTLAEEVAEIFRIGGIPALVNRLSY